MPSVTFAAPILPGKTDQDRAAIRSCTQGERRAAHEASRARVNPERAMTAFRRPSKSWTSNADVGTLLANR
jgi:hypothetical protein